jgi:hypothetical protein
MLFSVQPGIGSPLYDELSNGTAQKGKGLPMRMMNIKNQSYCNGLLVSIAFSATLFFIALFAP